MPVPLYGFLEGDSIGLLIVAEPGTTVGKLADLLQEAASLRVAPKARAKVLFRDRTLDRGQTLAQAGLTALDRFDVVEDRGQACS